MTDSSDRMRRNYALYAGSFFAFVMVLGVLEQHGMPPRWIGYAFLFLTIVLYATIGVLARTSNAVSYTHLDVYKRQNLPKTRSGKIMRRLLRSLAKGETVAQDVSTLENPAILEQLRGS